MIATTKRVTTQRYRHALASVAGLAALALPAAQAFAFSSSVINACADDYMSYCSSYDLENPKVRQCMRAVGGKLSQPCVNALVASGEVSKKEAARYGK